MSTSRTSTPTPRIVVDNSESSNHPSDMLLNQGSRSNSFQHDRDDDRTPFLDNPATESLDPQHRQGWTHKLRSSSERMRAFSKRKRNVIVGLLSIFLVVLLVVAFMSWRLFDRETATRGNNRQLMVHATHGAVATELDTCSNIGVNILQEGGNAVDAAIASGICIGSVNMFSAGIGGYTRHTIVILIQEADLW